MDPLNFAFQASSHLAQGRAFFAMLIAGGQILAPITVLAAHCQRNQYSRSPILMNVFYSIIIYSTAFCLSFYAGVWGDRPGPINWSLCRAQVILVYIAPLWMSVSTLCLALHLWFAVYEGSQPPQPKEDVNNAPRWPKHTRTAVLTVVPYCVVGSFTLVVYMPVIARPELVGLRYYFCGIDFQPLRTTAAIANIVVSSVILTVLGDIGRRLYTRNVRLALAQMKCQGWNVAPLFVRIAAIMIPVSVGLVSGVFASTNDSLVMLRTMLQGAIPLLLWLAFGTNPAIYLPDNRKLELNWLRRRSLKPESTGV